MSILEALYGVISNASPPTHPMLAAFSRQPNQPYPILRLKTKTYPTCRLAQPQDIDTVKPTFQPWRDLENEILYVYNRNVYDIVVTPDDLMVDDETLSSSVFQNGYS